MVGIIVDDTANEFDSASPSFGEKFSPPFLPVSIRDFTGKEISRVYSDEWGAYNALIPSTYTANLPAPSGMSPNMLTVCLNSPGPIPDPNHPGQFITDPFFNRQYSQFCYTFQYMPGTTTYLDTPVLPIAAFAGPNQFPLDCEFPNGTPGIYSVSGPQGGPYLEQTGQVITIVSQGMVAVPNPAFNPADASSSATVVRDYSFGSKPGKVTIGGVPLTNVNWSAGSISGTVATGTKTGLLMVKRGDNGQQTRVGITVTIGQVTAVVRVNPGGLIQEAIDLAVPGSLILVPPGNYEQLVIMWKNVRLQGWGAASTIINAIKTPAEKLIAWRKKMQTLIDTGAIDLLPGQETGGGLPEPGAFNTEEGPGIMVAAKDGAFTPPPDNARIDGFTITGADHGGGICVNGYIRYLEISNNLIINNQGFYGGGIRIGHPYLTFNDQYVDGENDFPFIHHNHITQNGSLGAAGGGIALFNGSDNYVVSDNSICGNFSAGNGGGIGHLGLSNQGIMANNYFLFNQSFNQGLTVSGGGIFIGGLAALGPPGSLGPGTGSVTINANLIQGNLAGAGDGGGIRTEFVSGQDVASSPNDSANWYTIDIFNNMIVNNVAGLAGGAISLQDTAKINIIQNTIANNDSTATASEAFINGPGASVSQPAGIVSRGHSTALAAVIVPDPVNPEYSSFSNPVFYNSILWHNRSFIWDVTLNNGRGGLWPDVGAGQEPVYYDLAVLGTPQPQQMNPLFCLLTDTNLYNRTNISADPGFINEYFNGSRGQIIIPEITTSIETAPAVDEGGNFIDVRFGPLTLINPVTGLLFGDYNIQPDSPAVDKGNLTILNLSPLLLRDFNGNVRPNGSAPDIGADELNGGQPPVYGPITSNVKALPNPTKGAGLVTLTAIADDRFTGNQNIAAAEWWEGVDPGPGAGHPMQVGGGQLQFNASLEEVMANIDVSGWAYKTYTLFVRSKDAAGNWGANSSTNLNVTSKPLPPAPPDWIIARRLNRRSIEITWAGNGQDIINYRLERNTRMIGNRWELVSDFIPAGVTGFIDEETPRRISRRYTYRIRSENEGGASTWVESNSIR